MFMKTVSLAPSWFQVKVGGGDFIYVDMEQRLFSIAPVFELKYLKDVCKNYLKMNFESKHVEKLIAQIEAKFSSHNKALKELDPSRQQQQEDRVMYQA